MVGKFFMLLGRLLPFFKINFLKKIFQEHTTSVSVLNGLDADQGQCSVSPDLGPNCLQRLSADDKSGHLQVKCSGFTGCIFKIMKYFCL